MLCPAKRSVVANLMRYSDARIPFLYLFSGSDAKTANSRIRLFRSALKRYLLRTEVSDVLESPEVVVGKSETLDCGVPTQLIWSAEEPKRLFGT